MEAPTQRNKRKAAADRAPRTSLKTSSLRPASRLQSTSVDQPAPDVLSSCARSNHRSGEPAPAAWRRAEFLQHVPPRERSGPQCSYLQSTARQSVPPQKRVSGILTVHICDFRCVQQAAAGMDLAAHYNVHFQPLYPLYCEWRACKRAETKVCLPVMHHVPLSALLILALLLHAI